MAPPFPPSEQYKRFIAWQCRLRKMSMRELGGRPTAGMSAGVHSVSGGEEQARVNFLIDKQDSDSVTSELRHIIKKTPDPAEWVKNGLRILAERHYQDDFNFSGQLTALFGLDSSVADALISVGECRLKFVQDSIQHEFDFTVAVLSEQESAYQATYWHNHLFNPTIPGKVQILRFIPQFSE